MQSMIADRVWFREGSDEFLAESAPAIQELADWLRGEAGARVEIRAYSDDMGSDRVNQILTQKRAEALRQARVSKGIAADRIRSRGFGKLNPIASNRTIDGRARNRRIEIFRFQ
jgi:outer membrane protein OmpA-like peptidoglycan-associated protein